jgi:hypothetical protein
MKEKEWEERQGSGNIKESSKRRKSGKMKVGKRKGEN